MPPPPPLDVTDPAGPVPPYAAPLTVTEERELRWPWIIAGAVAAGVFGALAFLALFVTLVAESGCLIGCGDPNQPAAAAALLGATACAALSGAAAAMVVRGGRWPRRSTAALAVAAPATMLLLTLLLMRVFDADPNPPVLEGMLLVIATGAWIAWGRWGRMHRLRDILAVTVVIPLTTGVVAGLLTPAFMG